MKFEKSLYFTVISLVLAVLVVCQGLLWLWFMFDQKAYFSDRLEEKVLNMGKVFAGVSLEAFKGGNAEVLNSNINAFMTDPDIASVKIIDKGGNIMAEKAFVKIMKTSLNPFYIDETMTVSVPLSDGGMQIGTVQVAYKGDSVNTHMKYLITIPPVFQMVVFVIMGFSIFYFFRLRVGRPIEDIQRKISLVTAGNLTVEFEKLDNKELNVIHDGLKFLIEWLSASISKLISTSNNVAAAIDQLNITFENVIKGSEQQTKALEEILVILKEANDFQQSIANNSRKLSEFSSENVTSLLEMKATAEEIVSSMNMLFQATENSYGTVAEMSQTSRTMAEAAENVLMLVEETAATVEEVTASVKEVENSARESTLLAENVRGIAAEKGVLTVAEAIDGMEQISDKVKFSVEIVRRLGTRSKDIEKMLSVIKDVTEQTNLLSLNAAILAAQAGEYGKGFSVVSDEIRALSDRTSTSTKEIAGIVSTIQNEIADAVTSIEDGMKHVESGSKFVYEAGESMGSILDAAQRSANMARTIEKATVEQAKALGQLTNSSENIRRSVMNMSRSASEQFKGSEFMLERVGEVKEVAEATKKGTEEQAAGTRIISKNIELANDKINEITGAVQNQQKQNETVLENINNIRSIGMSTLSNVQSVSFSLSSLKDEISNLRKEMENFKIKK